jgi:hypothetical protein
MMLTIYDLQALIDLLQRTPMSKAEQLFAGRLVETLTSLIEKPDDSPEEPETHEYQDDTGHEPE